MDLVFATWNIHGCMGRKTRFDAHATAHVLERTGADVIALQEVGFLEGPDGYHQAEAIASLLGMQFVFGSNLERLEGRYRYGNAILSKKQIVLESNVDLSVHGFEPRGCLVARTGGLRVASVHLGLLHHERAAQAKRLVDALSPDEPIVIGGDMNDWFPGRDTRSLRARFRDPGSRATYPAAFPLFRLDHVYVCDRVAVRKCEAVRTPLARAASDHLPLVAEVTVSYDRARAVSATHRCA